MRKLAAAIAAGFGAAAPMLARAQAAVDPAAGDVALNSGDNAWVLVSAVLVLLMTLPGLMLFYGGLVRTKNLVSVIIQIGAVAAAASVLWVVAGYRIAFGDPTNGWIGTGNMWLLADTAGYLHGEMTISERTFALFQMGLAALAAALMVGAWTGRARFGWVLGVCALWGLVVYAPVAHWVWGEGWLAAKFGTKDFAGGLVVLTAAGVSALVVTLLLGKRAGFPGQTTLPHSPALTMAGAALLWAGWLGLAGGSALTGDDAAASAIINTHLSASMAALTWLLLDKITRGKPTGIGFASGAAAGLAAISPAAGFVGPGGAILIGAAAALVCLSMLKLIKSRLEIDDALSVFAIFGVGGMTGSLLLAVFLSPALGGAGYDQGATMLSQFAAQVVGVGAVAIWSAIATAIIAVAVSLIIPMRVSEDDERAGLDLSAHGQCAWDFD